MKIASLALEMLICALLVAGCSKSTEPKKDNQDDGLELLTSGSVGPEGGVVETGRISVIVPAGTFLSSTNLKVYLDTNRPFGADQVSSTFLISGLPDDYTGSIAVRLKSDAEVSGTGMIAVGEENFLSISDEGSSVYTLFVATDSSGHLIAEIPAPAASSSPYKSLPKISQVAARPEGRTVTAVGDYSAPVSSTDGNWVVYMPGGFDSRLRDYMISDLSSALSSIRSLGFSSERLTFPVTICVAPLNERDFNRCVEYLPIYGKYWIFVDSEKLKVPETYYDYIDRGLGRELFHMILSSYDPNYFTGTQSRLNLEHYWFHTAVALWSEVLYGASADAIPVAFWSDSYIMTGDRGCAPFEGIQRGCGTSRYSSYEHGCGMSAMIKYLVNRYGSSLLASVYAKIRSGGTHPVAALISSTEDPIGEWWPEFISSYLTGDIYRYDPLGRNGDYGDGLKVNTSQLFRIRTDADSVRIFLPEVPDLAATDLYISLEYPDIDKAAMIRNTVDVLLDNNEGIVLKAYGYGRNKETYELDLQPWEEATQQLTISNIRDLIEAECQYIVLVLVNGSYHSPDFMGDKTVSLITEVLTPNFNYDRCDFIIYCDMTIKTVDSYGETNFTTDMGLAWIAQNGYFLGNTFHGEIVKHNQYEEGGTIEITIDPANYHVTEFKVNTLREDGGLVATWSVESNGTVDIPLSWQSPFNDAQDNEVTGTAVCDVTLVEMFWSFVGTTQTVEDISCNSSSYLTISLEKEDSGI